MRDAAKSITVRGQRTGCSHFSETLAFKPMSMETHSHKTGWRQVHSSVVQHGRSSRLRTLSRRPLSPRMAGDDSLSRARLFLQVLACQWLSAGVLEGALLGKMSDIMRKDVEKAVAEAPSKPEPQVLVVCQAGSSLLRAEIAVWQQALQTRRHGAAVRTAQLPCRDSCLGRAAMLSGEGAWLRLVSSTRASTACLAACAAALHQEGGGKAGGRGGRGAAGQCRRPWHARRRRRGGRGIGPGG